MPEIRLSGENCEFIVGTEWRTRSGYKLVFGVDGNLELLSPTRQRLWESGTRGKFGRLLSMQTDGNLVIYEEVRRRAIWSTDTAGNPGAFLAIQEDGNVVIYTGSGTPIWATGTDVRSQRESNVVSNPSAAVVRLKPAIKATTRNKASSSEPKSNRSSSAAEPNLRSPRKPRKPKGSDKYQRVLN